MRKLGHDLRRKHGLDELRVGVNSLAAGPKFSQCYILDKVSFNRNSIKQVYGSIR